LHNSDRKINTKKSDRTNHHLQNYA